MVKAKFEQYVSKAKSAIEVQYKSLPPASEVLDATLGKPVRPRKALDITSTQLAYGLKECVLSRESERAEVEKRLVQAFYKGAPEGTAQNPLCFGLCVRSIYDATLKSLNFPMGSVALMSAINIPDMVVITEAHGLKAIAVDLNPETLTPDPEELERTILRLGGRAKVFVLAHIFGARSDISALIQVCQKHNVFFIEDCAEAWGGPGVFLGNDQSDLTLFSFGTIKIATAMGGAIGRFKSLSCMNRVNDVLNTYPVRPVSTDAGRFAKYAVLNQVMKSDRVFGAVVNGLKTIRVDYDQLIQYFSRGFSRDQDLFAQMRVRPTVATLKLLLKKMQEFDYKRAQQRKDSGKALTQEMKEAFSAKDVVIPGSNVKDHEYWLFPVSIVKKDVDFKQVVKRMLNDGFDVTGGTTQLASLDMVVMDPQDPEFEVPINARKVMSRILYLPLGDGDGGAPVRRRLIKSLGRAIGVFDEDDEDDEDDDGTEEELRPEEDEALWFDSDDEEEIPVRAKL